jgi:hypothetical protein
MAACCYALVSAEGRALAAGTSDTRCKTIVSMIIRSKTRTRRQVVEAASSVVPCAATGHTHNKCPKMLQTESFLHYLQTGNASERKMSRADVVKRERNNPEYRLNWISTVRFRIRYVEGHVGETPGFCSEYRYLVGWFSTCAHVSGGQLIL